MRHCAIERLHACSASLYSEQTSVGKKNHYCVARFVSAHAMAAWAQRLLDARSVHPRQHELGNQTGGCHNFVFVVNLTTLSHCATNPTHATRSPVSGTPMDNSSHKKHLLALTETRHANKLGTKPANTKIMNGRYMLQPNRVGFTLDTIAMSMSLHIREDSTLVCFFSATLMLEHLLTLRVMYLSHGERHSAAPKQLSTLGDCSRPIH